MHCTRKMYFGTIEFFHMLGRHSRGQDLTFPGRVIPRMLPKSDGGCGNRDRPLLGLRHVAAQRSSSSTRRRTEQRGELRRDIHKVAMERPSARRALVRGDDPGIAHLDLRVRVDSERDLRDSLLVLATKERVDGTMMSAEQVASVLSHIEALRAAGLYS